jgi:hypothetical protein
MLILRPRGRNAPAGTPSVFKMVNRSIGEETPEDRREQEAARLEIAPARPGEDPPTYGDEGGGSLYPEHSSSATRRTFLERLSLRRRPRA